MSANRVPAAAAVAADVVTRRDTIDILLHRSGRTPLSVDPDLWIAALEIATAHGWRPFGTLELKGTGRPDPMGYLQSGPTRVTHEDALRLGEGLKKGLDLVPADMLPLQGGPFGEENTIQLLNRASKGEIPELNEVSTAIEVMSGPPRKDAESLATFMGQGEFILNHSSGGHGQT